MAQPAELESPGYNATDGVMFGKSSTKRIAFYGAIPVVRTITASTNHVSSTTSISISTHGIAVEVWGFNTQQEIININTAVSTMQLAMKQLGIIT